jgi:rubrerythrin
MDILGFAMQMEKDGQAFYEKHAAATNEPELREIFRTLAQEEARHFAIFRGMKEGRIEQTAKAVRERSNTLATVRNIFVQLSESGTQKAFGADVTSVWTEARGIEEKSEKFYRESASAEPDRQKKEWLNVVADEEKSHIYMIDGVLTFLKQPEAFAESAHFRNFQSLEGH